MARVNLADMKHKMMPARRGAVVATMVLGMAVVVAFAGFTLDIGLAALGAQECQKIADAGALAGAQEIRTPDYAQYVAWITAWANVPKQLSSTGARYWTSVSFIPEGGALGDGRTAPRNGALKVTSSKWVPYNFLRVIGVNGITVRREAIATGYLGGMCIAPIWIWYTTPVTYGQQVQLLMADAPHCGVPGSFGFLQPQGGVDFQMALKGTISLEQEELQRAEENDIVYAKTGLAVDHWRGPLKTDWDSRINRGTQGVYASDTFGIGQFHVDNPRIIIVPFVEYLDGTGSGARFRIHKFGAFWLEDVITNGVNRYIQGRFIDFMKPGGKVLGIKPGQLMM